MVGTPTQLWTKKHSIRVCDDAWYWGDWAYPFLILFTHSSPDSHPRSTWVFWAALLLREGCNLFPPTLMSLCSTTFFSWNMIKAFLCRRNQLTVAQSTFTHSCPWTNAFLNWWMLVHTTFWFFCCGCLVFGLSVFQRYMHMDWLLGVVLSKRHLYNICVIVLKLMTSTTGSTLWQNNLVS